MERAVVILSGGQDSTTCLFMAIKKYGEKNVEAVSFLYNNKYRKDVECARKICKDFNIKHIIFDAGIIHEVGNSNNVEGRNIVLITLVAMYAKVNSISNVIIGLSGNSIHPDCSEQFLDSIKETIKIAIGDINIEAPIINYNKEKIWKIADDLGMLEYIRDSTFSCWENQNEPCGKCLSCQMREKGLSEYIKSKRNLENE